MKLKYLAIALAASMAALSCSSDNGKEPDKTPEEPSAPAIDKVFAKGADVSWLSELEKLGYKFYTPAGQQMECMQLLRDCCGVNSIRLRVWVNPNDGWNSKQDVINKAKRAKALGQRLMVDFHFSDSWADPGQQTIPADWKDYDINKLTQAITDHVTDVLTALKDEGITPEWAQIGNETANGFLWPIGQLDKHPDNFAALVTAGHKAVKAVFPDCKTIVHTDQGNNEYRYDFVFGNLQRHAAQYDMIGVSFYPEVNNWKAEADKMLKNLAKAKATYGKETIVCEIGLQAQAVEQSTQMMKYVMDGCQGGVAKGLFYWEPEAPIGFNGGYDKGCFIDGKPTTALDCFKE